MSCSLRAARMCLRASVGKSSSNSERIPKRSPSLSSSLILSSSSRTRSSSSVVVAMVIPLFAGPSGEVDPQRIPLELCSSRLGFDKGARQHEVAPPRADLQNELVTVAQEAHLLLRRERQVERQDVATVLAPDPIGPAVEEGRRVPRLKERRRELAQHLEAD